MTGEDARGGDPGRADGGRTAASGTPFPVSVAQDRAARASWVVFLVGPVIWFAHFMLVYVVAEAGCTGGGHGLRVFDPPVPAIVTLAATAVAALSCLATAAWGYRRWRGRTNHSAWEERREAPGGDDDHDHGPLAFGGFLLSLLSLVTILGVGVPAAFLRGC